MGNNISNFFSSSSVLATILTVVLTSVIVTLMVIGVFIIIRYIKRKKEKKWHKELFDSDDETYSEEDTNIINERTRGKTKTNI